MASRVYQKTHELLSAHLNIYRATHLLDQFCEKRAINIDAFGTRHLSYFILWLSGTIKNAAVYKAISDDLVRYARTVMESPP